VSFFYLNSKKNIEHGVDIDGIEEKISVIKYCDMTKICSNLLRKW
jgi:hypothetical protein